MLLGWFYRWRYERSKRRGGRVAYLQPNSRGGGQVFARNRVDKRSLRGLRKALGRCLLWLTGAALLWFLVVSFQYRDIFQP